MHNHYFFLKWLVHRMNQVFPGSELAEIYSQEKDELVLRFWNSGDLYIRAFLRGPQSCLSFPAELHRAKRNSVDLFGELLGNKVEEVRIIPYDRSVVMQLENDLSLIFKMHGYRSNILVCEKGKVVELFRKKLQQDLALSEHSLERKRPDRDTLEKNNWDLQGQFPVLGGVLISEIRKGNWEEMDDGDKWERFSQMVDDWESLERVYLSTLDDGMRLSILPDDGEEYVDPMKALNVFLSGYLRRSAFSSNRSIVLQYLKQSRSRTLTYIQKTRKQYDKVKTGWSFSEQADLVMANLHRFGKGTRELTLTTFDGEREVLIKLKEGTTAVQHAENLYRKSKNQKIEEDKLQANIRKREQELKDLDRYIEEVESVSDRKALEPYLKMMEKRPSKQEGSEYMEFESDGFVIRVGRNAKNNDKLTFGNGYKEDMWMHVKDASGSHVLVKYRSDRKFSRPALETAAQLAAWYSKRKTEGLVPVITTPRKYVRKRKGDPAGAVVVEKEEVLLVSPASPAELGLTIDD